MNSNYFWQSAPISIIPTAPACFYFDQMPSNYIKQANIQSSYQELKKKCKSLELENSQLKEEILILQRIKRRKSKRIVKRRKQEELDKKFKCSHFNCKKQYASALALNLHMRTKHLQDSQIVDSSKKNDIFLDQVSVKQQGEYSKTILTKIFGSEQ